MGDAVTWSKADQMELDRLLALDKENQIKTSDEKLRLLRLKSKRYRIIDLPIEYPAEY